MKDLRSRSLVLGTLALLIVIGLILDEFGALMPLEGLFVQLTRPLQRLMDGITDQVVDASVVLTELRTLRQRNRQLEELVDRLMIENVRLKETDAQNEDLRKKLQFSETHPQYIIKAAEVKARVIGREPNNLMSILLIDAGQRDGIRQGMPVVTDRGLVGAVYRVGPNWAKVLLIIDPSSSVSALVQSSRTPGVVSGQLGENLLMDYIPLDGDLAVGDVILTSGINGRYPKGLVIGQVVEVIQHDMAVARQAVIAPSVNFEQLETVLVITTFDPLDVQAILEDQQTPQPTITGTPSPQPRGATPRP